MNQTTISLPVVGQGSQTGSPRNFWINQNQTGLLFFSADQKNAQHDYYVLRLNTDFFNQPTFTQQRASTRVESNVLAAKFRAEKEKYGSYLTEQVLIDPEEIFDALLALPFSNSAVELVPDNVLKITLVLPDGFLLAVSMPTNEVDQSPVFSLSKEDELLMIDMRPLADIIRGVREILQEN